MKKIPFIITLAIAAPLFLMAQQMPKSFNTTTVSSNISIEQMPSLDVATLMAEDEINMAEKIGPYKFGENINVNLNLNNSGNWEELKKGRLWRVGILSEGSFSLNFIFNDFFIPEGGTLHFYNEDRTQILGPYTAADNRTDRGFATFPLAGQLIFIEYYEPNTAFGEGSISFETVTHAYRNLFVHYYGEARGGDGGSGACNNNINCPEANAWQNEKRSVAIIIVGGSGSCTGAMVNNTAQDGTPYFLTANHCLGADVSNWSFKFDYQSPGCTNAGAPSLNSGFITSGATLRASNPGSDFGLIELNTIPPASHNVYYAGWDNSGTVPSSQVAIHHPSGDIKKISFDTDAPTTAIFGGAETWHIGDWEDGTTEPGSSGSPLFDQNHRIIGQLFGGSANCSNNTDDFYGRFDVSWPETASTSLNFWLDPGNSGVTTLDGFDPNQPQVAVDASAQSILGIFNGEIRCSSEVTPVFTLRNAGQDNLTAATIAWEIDNVAQTPINWTGNLNTNQTEDIPLPTQTFSPGAHSFAFSILSANGGNDLNPNNNTVEVTFTIVDSDEMSVNILTDNYGDETSWEITDSTNNIVASGNGYADNTQYNLPACLAQGCYTFTIFDDANDGLCCGFGIGDYLILSSDGDTLGFGAQFGANESINFCLLADTNNVGITNVELKKTISLFPNPTSGLLQVEFEAGSNFANVVLVDVVGRWVSKINLTGMQRKVINFNGLAEGIYYLRFNTDTNSISRKVVYTRTK